MIFETEDWDRKGKNMTYNLISLLWGWSGGKYKRKNVKNRKTKNHVWKR